MCFKMKGFKWMSIEEWKPSAYGKASITIKNTNFSLESLGWLSEDRANASNYLATQEQVKTGGDGLKMHCSMRCAWVDCSTGHASLHFLALLLRFGAMPKWRAPPAWGENQAKCADHKAFLLTFRASLFDEFALDKTNPTIWNGENL